MFTRCLASFLFFLTAFSLSLQSQEHLNLSILEDSLASVQRKIMKSENDSARQSLNFCFKKTLKAAIELPGSFVYSFDSLKKLAKMTSGDKRFRIYNWNLPVTDGSNLYFCFLQIIDKKNKNNFRIIELKDRSDSIPDPEHSILNSNSWYGALYYKIITKNSVNGMIYTLLGWEGKNRTEMQKIIEVLSFDNNYLPHFGETIFNKYKDGQNKRVIFRYSPLATMALRYEEQAISKGKKWNASRQTFQESHSKASMIVCDRLILAETTESKLPVFVPAGDVYDGFLFQNNRWNFIQGVDARNK